MPFELLCHLLEADQSGVHPDAVRYSGAWAAYQHLVELEILGTGNVRVDTLLCTWCGTHDLWPVQTSATLNRGYCIDCGWVALATHEIYPLVVNADRIVKRLAQGLHLSVMAVKSLVPDRLWQLGEIHFRRKRWKVFFGRRLGDEMHQAECMSALSNSMTPGASVVITSTDVVEATARYSAYRFVPLGAIAHLKKKGFVIENFTDHLDQPTMHSPSQETSLLHLQEGRVALIEGETISLSQQVFEFLNVLYGADGAPVHKREIADELNLSVDDLHGADVFRHHKTVYQTFVGNDRKGRYWLKPIAYGREADDESSSQFHEL